MFVFSKDLKAHKEVQGKWTCKDSFKVQKIDYVDDKIDNVDINTIYKLYKVNELSELTEKQYANINQFWDKLKEA